MSPARPAPRYRMRLIILNGERKGDDFEVLPPGAVLGRSESNESPPDIDLRDYDAEGKISRRHAHIGFNGSSLTIEDLTSLNGTFINREKFLDPGTTYALRVGDEILIGALALKVELDPLS